MTESKCAEASSSERIRTTVVWVAARCKAWIVETHYIRAHGALSAAHAALSSPARLNLIGSRGKGDALIPLPRCYLTVSGWQ